MSQPKLKRDLIGGPKEMYSFANQILETPNSKRIMAQRAIDTRYPTEVKNRSGLCRELNNEMYKDELYELALSLSLPITKRTSKADLCNQISKYATESLMINEPNDISEEEALENLEKAVPVEAIWQGAVDKYGVNLLNLKTIYQLNEEFGEKAFPKAFAHIAAIHRMYGGKDPKKVWLSELLEAYSDNRLSFNLQTLRENLARNFFNIDTLSIEQMNRLYALFAFIMKMDLEHGWRIWR
jgi:hypothetical protein